MNKRGLICSASTRKCLRLMGFYFFPCQTHERACSCNPCLLTLRDIFLRWPCRWRAQITFCSLFGEGPPEFLQTLRCDQKYSTETVWTSYYAPAVFLLTHRGENEDSWHSRRHTKPCEGSQSSCWLCSFQTVLPSAWSRCGWTTASFRPPPSSEWAWVLTGAG